jgi:hypothetical protein
MGVQRPSTRPCEGVARMRRWAHIPHPGGAAMGDYIGIDLHKTKSFVTRMTAQGHIREQVNLLHTTGGLAARERKRDSCSLFLFAMS